jgi:hypothetical protein
MSIGYRALEHERRKSDGARLLKQIRLFECSFVSMPMHPDAGLESISKGGAGDLDTAIASLSKAVASLKRFKAHVANITHGGDEMSELVALMHRFSAEARQAGDPFVNAELALHRANALLDRMQH